MLERPKLITHLPSSLRAKYGRIPKEQRHQFEDNMHAIKRWGEGKKPEEYGDISYLPKPPGFSESNLEHTIGMLQMVDELTQYSPIRERVAWDEVRAMAIIHDSGEIRIDDAPSSGPVRESRKWKVRKSYEEVAVYGILAELNDPAICAHATQVYDRYMTRSPGDVEALIANFLDKAHGTLVTGPTIFNNFRQNGDTAPSPELMVHVVTNLGVVYDKAEAVLKSPLDLPSTLKFRDYLRALYRNLDEVGYEVPLRMARARLDVDFWSQLRAKQVD